MVSNCKIITHTIVHIVPLRHTVTPHPLLNHFILYNKIEQNKNKVKAVKLIILINNKYWISSYSSFVEYVHDEYAFQSLLTILFAHT